MNIEELLEHCNRHIATHTDPSGEHKFVLLLIEDNKRLEGEIKAYEESQGTLKCIAKFAAEEGDEQKRRADIAERKYHAAVTALYDRIFGTGDCDEETYHRQRYEIECGIEELVKKTAEIPTLKFLEEEIQGKAKVKSPIDEEFGCQYTFRYTNRPSDTCAKCGARLLDEVVDCCEQNCPINKKWFEVGGRDENN